MGDGEERAKDDFQMREDTMLRASLLFPAV